MLRALGLVDIETLRKEIGHEILVKGLRRIGYEALGRFKDEFSRMFVENLIVFCKLISSCPDTYKHIDEMLKSTAKGAEDIQEWLDKKYDKEIKGGVDKLGNVIFSENRDAERKIDKLLDETSIYVVNITEAIKKFGIEPIIVSYWKFEKAARKCLKKRIRDRNKLAGSLAELDKYSRWFMELSSRIFYLLDVYLLFLTYHALFENKV